MTSPFEKLKKATETVPPQKGLTEREKKSQDYVESKEQEAKKLVAMRAKNKEALYDKWLKNKETAERPEIFDDPRYLALRDIPESMSEIKTEAAGLLHMYEKFLGDRKQTLELYKKCWGKNGKFDIDVLRKEFTREKTLGKTGFYYGKKTVIWKPQFRAWWSTITESIKKAGYDWKTRDDFGGRKCAVVTVNGWFAHDIDEKWISQGSKFKDYKIGSNLYTGAIKHDFEDGYNFTKSVLSKLKGGGYGDEYLGKSFKEAMKNLGNELKPETVKTERDSGLSPRQEGEVLEEAKKALELHSGVVYKEEENEKLLAVLTKQASNKWFALPSELIGSMVFVFGKDGVNPKDYFYRYMPDKKRIYFVRSDGANVSESQFGGYIEIDEKGKKKSLKEWKGMNQKDFEKEMKTLIDGMKDEDIVKELIDYGHESEELSLLDRTKGMVTAAAAFTNGILISKLKDDFYDPIRKDLHAKLEKQGIKAKEIREKYVEARIADLKAKLDKQIEENSLIQSAIKESQDVKISISLMVDSVKADIADINIKKKLEGLRAKAAAAKDSIEEKAKSLYGEVEDKVKKTFKGASGIVMMLLGKVFKITPEGIKDYLSGGKEKAFSATGIVLGFLGIKKGASVFGSSKLDQKSLDEAIAADKKEKILSKDIVFSENVKLTNKKILIPKGKGIQPGGKLKVTLDGRESEIDKKSAKKEKPQEKAKKGFLGMFGGGDEDVNVQFKESEIVIEKDTIIPKDTVIPKGAKIIKI